MRWRAGLAGAWWPWKRRWLRSPRVIFEHYRSCHDIPDGSGNRAKPGECVLRRNVAIAGGCWSPGGVRVLFPFVLWERSQFDTQ